MTASSFRGSRSPGCPTSSPPRRSSRFRRRKALDACSPVSVRPRGPCASRYQRACSSSRNGPSSAAATTGRVLLYLHSSVLGAIAISAFWSLLNERFDPHSAKPLMARVAAAADLRRACRRRGGGASGGAPLPECAAAVLGVVARHLRGRSHPASRAACRSAGAAPEAGRTPSGWRDIRRVELLRDLAPVVALAAMLAALVDYVLKAEAVGLLRQGRAAGAFLRPLLRRYRRRCVPAPGHRWAPRAQPPRPGGSVQPPGSGRGGASSGLVMPGALGGHPPSRLSMWRYALRSFAPATNCSTPRWRRPTKRSAKSIIDVAGDCLGKAPAPCSSCS